MPSVAASTGVPQAAERSSPVWTLAQCEPPLPQLSWSTNAAPASSGNETSPKSPATKARAASGVMAACEARAWAAATRSARTEFSRSARASATCATTRPRAALARASACSDASSSSSARWAARATAAAATRNRSRERWAATTAADCDFPISLSTIIPVTRSWSLPAENSIPKGPVEPVVYASTMTEASSSRSSRYRLAATAATALASASSAWTASARTAAPSAFARAPSYLAMTSPRRA